MTNPNEPPSLPYRGGPPWYGYGEPYPRTQSRMAVASLILGIFGFFTLGITAILGVIFGSIALRRIDAGTEAGRGIALAGWITSSVALALWALIIIVNYSYGA